MNVTVIYFCVRLRIRTALVSLVEQLFSCFGVRNVVAWGVSSSDSMMDKIDGLQPSDLVRTVTGFKRNGDGVERGLWGLMR